MLNWIAIFVVLAAAQVSPVLAQQAERIQGAASQAKDLTFPKAPTPAADARMGLHKPSGAGPFPAIVMHHQCSGLGSASRPNKSMVSWAKEAVAKGYVVLLVDSLGPRNVDTLCMGPKNGVNFFRGAKDAYQAAEYLRSLDFVDKKRIAHVGFSWGGMVGVMASSKAVHHALGSEGFAASVAFYPGCFTLNPPQGRPYEMIANADIDRPLLVLMGDKDTETPAAECVTKLGAAKSAGSPVEWHVYPSATHCFDCAHNDGFSKTDNRGNHVVYRYDAALTKDAGTRMFEFLGKTLKP
jgi:dienelactone hydrolase